MPVGQLLPATHLLGRKQLTLVLPGDPSVLSPASAFRREQSASDVPKVTGMMGEWMADGCMMKDYMDRWLGEGGMVDGRMDGWRRVET